jgi:putative ABC transport system permease protein
MLTFTWLETLWQDLCYAARGLRKNPGFTAVVMFSLALGIGANSTIFSVLNAVMFRPLPFDQPDRLMMIWETEQGRWTAPPVAEIVDWNQQNRVFEDIASTSGTESAPLGGAGQPELIPIQYVSPNFFSVLRVKPVLGRVFFVSEIHDLTQTVVISSDFWTRRFNNDPNVLGKTFSIQGVMSTVVGVMPPGFAPFYGEKIDLWYPINPAGDRYSKRDDRGWLRAIGRLKANLEIGQAQAEMNVIARRLELAYPAVNRGIGVKIEPLHEALFRRSGQALYPVAGAVGFVLLIACVNVANLLLSRTETRRKEHALRASLGAGRLRLMQQTLVESGLLGLLGGALGSMLAVWGIRLFRALIDGFPNTDSISIDGRVLGFTLAASLGTAVLFGFGPAMLASRVELNAILREGESRTVTGSRGLTRQALAIAEMALAVVLLVGAGLMIASVLRLKQVDPGFDPQNVMTADISLPEGGKYLDRVPGGSMEETSALVNPFWQRLLEKASALPGVESAGLISHALGSEGETFSILGRTAPPPDKRWRTGYNEVSPSLFHVLKIPLKRGRYLDAHDVQSAPWAAVINESFARHYFPNEDAIGQQLLLQYAGFDVNEPQPRRIVGIVGDVKQYGLGRATPDLVYECYLQQPAAFPGGSVLAHISKNLVIKTASGLAARGNELAASIKKIVAELDPDQPVAGLMSMNQRLAESIDDARFYMRLMGIFAAIAVLLAAVGIYGMMAYFVSERTREIGIRIALGAQRSNVLRMVAKLGLKLTLIGLAIGIGLAMGLTRLISRFLFGVSATDPITFAAVAMVLAAVALLACYIPALRATRVDPMVALRYE